MLYAGTETGIFVTLDRGRSWRRLKGNLPTVRVDELTIHPRDNALLVATHGRALWVLDHLEPIQEYTAAQRADASLFTPGMALQWKSKDDRNDEFWGHQFFTGENPPTDAVIQVHFKKPAANPMLRISDAAGRMVRELPIPNTRNQPGIQTVCWDQRVQPVPAITPVTLPRAAGAAQPQAPQGGRGGGGGGGGGGARPIPGYPAPLPAAGYLPENPCAQGGGPGGGGGGGFGGGGANAGPYVAPGRYTVALVADGKVVESKPMTIVMDPQVPLTGEARTRYNAMIMELHDAQRAGTEVANKLNALYADMMRLAPQVDSSTAGDAVKTQWATFRSDMDSVRVKFGVPVTAGAGAAAFGGGRGGGAAAQAAAAANALGRVAAAKASIQGIWELPSEATAKQATDARAALAAAVRDANALLTRARALSTTLAAANLKLTVPN